MLPGLSGAEIKLCKANSSIIAKFAFRSETCQFTRVHYDTEPLREMAILLLHVITTALRLRRPGGAGSIIAEPLLVKRQLLIINRSRHRGPNLNREVRSHPTPRLSRNAINLTRRRI